MSEKKQKEKKGKVQYTESRYLIEDEYLEDYDYMDEIISNQYRGGRNFKEFDY